MELVVTNYFHPRHFEVVGSLDQWYRLKSIRFLSTKCLRIYSMLPVHVVKEGSSIVTINFILESKYLVQLTFSSSDVCREPLVRGVPLDMVKSRAHTILMTQFPLT